MPRRCTICYHDNREEINLEILKGEISYPQIAKKHGVSLSAIKRHVGNHLKPMIAERQAEVREQLDPAAVMKTIEALDAVIERLPRVLDDANLNQILRAIELRARYTGEEAAPTQIQFVWGKGLETEDTEGIEDMVAEEEPDMIFVDRARTDTKEEDTA